MSISAPALTVGQHKIKLINTSGNFTVPSGTDTLVGTSEEADAGAAIASRSFIVGLITVTGSQNLEIQHFTENSVASVGLGRATDDGEAEIYTIAEFWKK